MVAASPVLFVRKAVLSPTVAMAHIRALEKGTAKYALRPVDCKVYSIPQGAMSSTHENLFLGTLPKRIILWCVDNDALNGAFDKNPFHAKNNAINFLAVYVDGRQVPAKPLQPNFETGQYVRSYVNLFSATGKHAHDEGNELTRDDFGNGYTFFGFDLTPDACDGVCFHLVQKGNLRIEIHFAAALAQTVNVVVYGESEAVLEIDKNRNIIYDHWCRRTRYRTCCRATSWCAARTTSLPKTVCRRSSTRTRRRSCATHTTPIDRENTGSPCTLMPRGAATTSIRTDCGRNTSSSRTLWTNIVPRGCLTTVRCRARCRPFAVNTASHSWCFAAVMFRCMHLLACSRPIWWRTIVACLTGSLLWIKNDDDVFVRVCCVRVCCVVHTKGQRSRNEGSRFLYHCALQAGRTAPIGRLARR